ncbi:MAG: imidazole glycerol phosphate synthase subunit HisH [Candidatus Marinimicrobia bacterium]|nr:imidazole glycerol phosphate synthase subunit HisH [Candidatus Neomarinimicrobiota bacterium]
MSVIIDTGCANLTSLKFALERMSKDVQVSDDPDTINSAERVFLPGVGSAQYAMGILEQKGLIQTIQGLQQPVLGICLGMQLLTSFSTEGDVACLNCIPAEVGSLQSLDRRLPHMGWNTINGHQNHPLFRGIPENDYFYFVHSYGVEISAETIAICEYGKPFSAAIAYKNFMGVQFHPERSGKSGAKILKNFLELKI